MKKIKNHRQNHQNRQNHQKHRSCKSAMSKVTKVLLHLTKFDEKLKNTTPTTRNARSVSTTLPRERKIRSVRRSCRTIALFTFVKKGIPVFVRMPFISYRWLAVLGILEI